MGEIYIDKNEFYYWHEGKLFQAHSEAEGKESSIGSEYVARIIRVEKGLDGALVDLGLNKGGFLPLRSAKKAEGLKEGQAIHVLVKRDAFDEKGPRLDLKDPNPAMILEPPYLIKPALPLWQRCLAPLNPVAISAIYGARRVDIEALSKWAQQHAPEWLSQNLIRHHPRRDWPELREAVSEGLEESVTLANGGNLLFETTRTLHIIDVNSGQATSSGGMETLAWAVNSEAAREIPRQISLRNWGGIVIIDFIDLKSAKRRAELVDLLKAESHMDPLIEWIGPMSRLGLVEIKRRRRGKILSEMFGA